MPLQAIETRRLYRQIADQLAGLIAAGEYPPGTRLPAERDLAEQLGVSRPSVREALIALEVEGLVEVRSGSGVYVLPPSIAERPSRRSDVPGPFDVIRARWLVEGDICGLAARAATAEQLAAIDETVKAMGQCRSDDPAWIELDQQFHLRIAQATGNAALVLMVKTLWDQRTDPLYLQLEHRFNPLDSWSHAVQEHGAIYRALAARDARLATQLMHKHMENAEARLSSSALGSEGDATHEHASAGRSVAG